MPILLEELIKQVPRETEQEVREAKDRFNARVRHALRGETRLTLRRRAEAESGTNETVAVPIVVVPGLPDALRPHERQAIEDKYHLAILLAPYRRGLTALQSSGTIMAERLIPTLDADPVGRDLLDGREISVETARDYADFLLKKLGEFDLAKFILRVDEDVLGCYTYRVQPYWDHPKPVIELYWGIIGLIARDLRVPVGDLTYVVLAHELAHAYTHVSFDADDHAWDTDIFEKSAHELKEGLAQFYALQVCKRVESSGPGTLAAFNTLLPHQPAAYHTHARWTESTPEYVRLAMLETRRSGKAGTLEQFEACLHGARSWLHH